MYLLLEMYILRQDMQAFLAITGTLVKMGFKIC